LDSHKAGFAIGLVALTAILGVGFTIFAALLFRLQSPVNAFSLFFWSLQTMIIKLSTSPLGLERLWPDDYGAIAFTVLAIVPCTITEKDRELDRPFAALIGFDISIAGLLAAFFLYAVLQPHDPLYDLEFQQSLVIAAPFACISALFAAAGSLLAGARRWWWVPQSLAFGALAYIAFQTYSLHQQFLERAA
jgi:hypothetical protein